MEEKSNIIRFWRFFPRPWPTIWLWIMLANIVLGIATPASRMLMLIRLSGIILCLFYAIRYFPKDYTLQLAMLITVVSDLILAGDNTAAIGVLCFLLAQIIHLLRLSPDAAKTPVFILAIIVAGLVLLNNFLQIFPPVVLIGGFYFLFLLANTGVSWRWWRQNRRNLQAGYAFWGFLFFIFCDLCIATSYLALIQVFPSFCYAPANFFAWFFYYPSQILVSNSSKYAIMYPKGR